MIDLARNIRIPPFPELIAGSLVVLGLLLMLFVAGGFLILAGLGAFGPGILRELGWLNDQDEFQRQAAHRAGYHGYLAGGFTAVLAIACLRWREANFEGAELAMLVLLVLWLTWLFSSLFVFWGAPKAAARVLIIYGSFWAVFVIGALLDDMAGPGGLQLIGILMSLVFVMPFFILAWTAGRWPRVTAVLLIVVPAIFLLMTAPMWIARSFPLHGMLITSLLLLVPMIACGIGLFRHEGPDAKSGEE